MEVIHEHSESTTANEVRKWLQSQLVDITDSLGDFVDAEDFGQQYFSLFMEEGIMRIPVIGVLVDGEVKVFMQVMAGGAKQEHSALLPRIMAANAGKSVKPIFSTSFEGMSYVSPVTKDYLTVNFASDRTDLLAGKHIYISIGSGTDNPALGVPQFNNEGRELMRNVLNRIPGLVVTIG